MAILDIIGHQMEKKCRTNTIWDVDSGQPNFLLSHPNENAYDPYIMTTGTHARGIQRAEITKEDE